MRWCDCEIYPSFRLKNQISKNCVGPLRSRVSLCWLLVPGVYSFKAQRVKPTEIAGSPDLRQPSTKIATKRQRNTSGRLGNSRPSTRPEICSSNLRTSTVSEERLWLGPHARVIRVTKRGLCGCVRMCGCARSRACVCVCVCVCSEGLEIFVIG